MANQSADWRALSVSAHRKRIILPDVSPTESSKYRAGLDVVGLMRRHPRYSLTSASDEVGVDPRTVRRHVGSALEKHGNRYRVKRWDRLTRELDLLDERGRFTVVTRSSNQASTIGTYHNAVRAYVIRGDDSALRLFDGKSIRIDGKDYPFLTDRKTLDRLARAGELKTNDIYPGTT
jgi:hypothetical protein